MKLYNATSTVLSLRKLEMQGNILPPSWLHHLRYENGKPHPIAAIILSDVVYWYRPIELRDEATGLVTGYAQKFKEDRLQRDYQSYVNQYGFTYHQVRAAFQCLVDIGVIDLELRTVQVSPNRKMGNVMYIGLNPETLQSISDPPQLQSRRGTRTESRSPSRLQSRTPPQLESRSPSRLQSRTLQRLHDPEITCSTENTNTEISDDDDGSSSPSPLFVQESFTHSDPRVEIRAMRKLAGDIIASMGANAWTDREGYISQLPDGELVLLLSWLWLWQMWADPYPDADAAWKREQYKRNPFDGIASVPGKIITQVRLGAKAELLEDDWLELEETILAIQQQLEEEAQGDEDT